MELPDLRQRIPFDLRRPDGWGGGLGRNREGQDKIPGRDLYPRRQFPHWPGDLRGARRRQLARAGAGLLQFEHLLWGQGRARHRRSSPVQEYGVRAHRAEVHCLQRRRAVREAPGSQRRHGLPRRRLLQFRPGLLHRCRASAASARPVSGLQAGIELLRAGELPVRLEAGPRAGATDGALAAVHAQRRRRLDERHRRGPQLYRRRACHPRGSGHATRRVTGGHRLDDSAAWHPDSGMRRAVPDARAARFRASLAAAALRASAAISPAAQALDRSALAEIALGDASAKQKAIDAAVAAGDAQAAPILTALLEGRLYVEGGKRALIAAGEAWIDPLTQKPAEPPPAEDLEKVSINNRMRRGLERALAALALAAPAAADRLAAARSLQDSADEAVLPAIELALQRETDPLVAEALRQAAAVLALSSSDRARRLAAIEQLLRAPSTRNKRLLLQRWGQGENDAAAERDPAVRAELRRALDSIDASLRLADLAGLVFGGLSLGSILLLAALGLAITFGLMGVINMAHGELLMIGAYATWLVQSAFRSSRFVDW